MHGLEDYEVPINHSYLLFKRCKNVYEGWWVEKAGHNNIDVMQRKTYFKKIFEFLDWLREKQAGLDDKQLLKRNKAEKWKKEFKHFYRQFLEDGGRDEGGRNEQVGEYKGEEGKIKGNIDEQRRESRSDGEGRKEEEKTESCKGSKKEFSSEGSMQKSSKLSIEMPQSFSVGEKDELAKRTMAKEEK